MDILSLFMAATLMSYMSEQVTTSTTVNSVSFALGGSKALALERLTLELDFTLVFGIFVYSVLIPYAF